MTHCRPRVDFARIARICNNFYYSVNVHWTVSLANNGKCTCAKFVERQQNIYCSTALHMSSIYIMFLYTTVFWANNIVLFTELCEHCTLPSLVEAFWNDFQIWMLGTYYENHMTPNPYPPLRLVDHKPLGTASLPFVANIFLPHEHIPA